jgi:hypothetical protein
MSDNNLKNTLIARLPGASIATIELEMSNAAREFFLESGAWHETIIANMVEGRSRYDFFPESGSIGFISDLWINGQRYTPVSGNSLPIRGWTGYFQVLTPTPSETVEKAIQINASVIPDECGCSIPPDLLNHYFEALLDNTLGKLYSHVNKPYTNLQMAMFHTGRYRAHLARARAVIAGGNVRAGGPWMFPQIASGHRRGSIFPRGA